MNTVLTTCFLAAGALDTFGAEHKPNFLFVYTDDHRWDAVEVVHLDYLRHITGADENLGRLLASIRVRKSGQPTFQ